MGRSTFQLLLLAFVFLQSYAKAEPRKNIRNAEFAKPKQLPYQVYLVNKKNGNHRTDCSGVIVSESAILTPAHCVENSVSVDIYFGTPYIHNEMSRQKMTIDPKDIILYSYPHKLSNGFEISLIRLDIKLIFDNFIQPALLPYANQDFSNHTLIVSDWIDSEAYEVNSLENGAKQLMFIEGQVVSPEICQHRLETKSLVENTNCIGSSASNFKFGESAITVARNTDGSFTLFSISKMTTINLRIGIGEAATIVSTGITVVEFVYDAAIWVSNWLSYF